MTGEVQNCSDKILWLVPPSDGQHRESPLLDPWLCHDIATTRRLGETGRDRVHIDFVGCPLESQRASQLVDACLSRAISHASLESDNAKVRSDVDDLAAPLRDH